MKYSVSDASQIYDTFNTIEKRYPNGDVSIKKLKFTASRRKSGWEKADHDYKFLAKEKEAQMIGERIYGKWLWNEMCKTEPYIDTGKIEPLQTKNKIENQDREQYLKHKAMDNIVKTREKVYDIARANIWNYFITLTFNDRVVDRYNYSDCVKKVTKFLDNFKQRNKATCPNFRYLIIHEKHDDGAYHFHGLIYLDKPIGLTLALYPMIHRLGGKPIYKKSKQVFNWGTYTSGYSTVTEIQNLEATCKYILKYITKDIDKSYIKGRRRFMYSSNCAKPIVMEHTTSDDDYKCLSPIYDTQFSTGYAYNQLVLLSNYVGNDIYL